MNGDSLSNTQKLVSPYKGRLVNLVVTEEERAAAMHRASTLPSGQLSPRSLCDIELLSTGAFSPLEQFMCRADYERVLDQMRLADGTLFPIPITLPIEVSHAIEIGKEVALRSPKNELIAIMKVEEVFDWDLLLEAQSVYGTTDVRHPMVSEMDSWPRICVCGPLKVINLPRHYDFLDLRHTPAQVRALLKEIGYTNVVAFQTRNPLHRAHEELMKRAAQEVNGALLLHPAVGMTKPGDVDHYTRVRTYRTLADRYFDHTRVVLSLLPLAMRLAGPREALWHAIIRRNYGANYLIVGRDHASPGLDSTGDSFYGAYDAQEMVEHFSEELGVGVIPFREMVYIPEQDRYEEISKIPSNVQSTSMSGTQVRDEYLNDGKQLPAWFTRPEVAEILVQSYPPRHRQGVCVWFTGLSASGKSTTAEVLTVLLMEEGRQVTLLDGDVVRTHLSKGLGFSKEDRDTNIRRIGFVAAEIVRHGGVAVCAAVSPYRATREDVRSLVRPDHFVEVFVDTPLEVCEQRDAKGMYAKARRGEIKGFTGIDDPYEVPVSPELTLSTTNYSAEENARRIIRYLIQKGFLLDG